MTKLFKDTKHLNPETQVPKKKAASPKPPICVQSHCTNQEKHDTTTATTPTVTLEPGSPTMRQPILHGRNFPKQASLCNPSAYCTHTASKTHRKPYHRVCYPTVVLQPGWAGPVEAPPYYGRYPARTHTHTHTHTLHGICTYLGSCKKQNPTPQHIAIR